MTSPGKNDKISCDRILVGYFQDEQSFQGPTVALLRHIETEFPNSKIDVVDFSQYTNSSSFSEVARLFGLYRPVESFIEKSKKTNWLLDSGKMGQLNFDSPKFRAAIKSDLFSILQTDPLPRGIQRKSLEKKLISNGEAIFSSTKHLLSQAKYGKAYILNGRHSANAAFWIACDEFDLETFFWESSNTFDSVYLCNHSIHNFYALLDEARSLATDYPNHDFSKAKDWFETRLNSKGEATFRRTWDAKHTSKWLSGAKAISRISYFSSSTDEYMSLGEMSPDRIWGNQYDALAKLKIDSHEDSPVLTIRMHPNTTWKSSRYCIRELARILSLQKLYPNIEIIWPNSRIDSYELLRNSEVVLSSGSTIALEAMYLGIPTYHLDHSSYIYASNETIIDFSRTYEELKSAFNEMRSRHAALVNIQLMLDHERIKVRSEDQVKNWNRFFSLIAYRDFTRLYLVGSKPIRYFVNNTIFLTGKFILVIGRVRINRLRTKIKNQ